MNDNHLMSCAVYIKNFCNTVLKDAKSQKTTELQTQAGNTILEIVKVLVGVVLSPTLQTKYKHNITMIMGRLLIFLQEIDSSEQQVYSYTILNELVA